MTTKQQEKTRKLELKSYCRRVHTIAVDVMKLGVTDDDLIDVVGSLIENTDMLTTAAGVELVLSCSSDKDAVFTILDDLALEGCNSLHDVKVRCAFYALQNDVMLELQGIEDGHILWHVDA